MFIFFPLQTGVILYSVYCALRYVFKLNFSDAFFVLMQLNTHVYDTHTHGTDTVLKSYKAKANLAINVRVRVHVSKTL